MVNLEFIEEKCLSLPDVKVILNDIKKRDVELNLLSSRLNEYLDAFVTLSPQKKEQLHQKLLDLNLTRLKEEHIAKIMEFLPTTAADLKVVLQAYPLSLVKKDQESIAAAVKGFV